MQTEQISDEGRCVSCGFLAKWDNTDSAPPPHFYELSDRDRRSGVVIRVLLAAEPGRTVGCIPWCYRNVCVLPDEIRKLNRELGSGTPEYMAASEVFRKDRHCAQWHRYTPGFSPKEHWEQVIMTELELKRQMFEKNMAREHNEMMERIDQSNKAFQLSLNRDNKRFQFILSFVLGAIAVLEIIVGMLQVVYPMGWPWLQQIFGIVR